MNVIWSPMYTVWQIFGLAPMGTSNDTWLCKKFLGKWHSKKIFNVASFWVFVSVIFLTMKFFVQTPTFNNESVLGSLAFTLTFIIGRGKIIWMQLTTAFSQHKYYKLFLRAISEVDLLLSKRASSPTWLMRWLMALLAFMIGVGVLLSHFRYRNSCGVTYIIGVAFYSYISAFDALILLQYVTSVLELWARFKRLNIDLLGLVAPDCDVYLAALVGTENYPRTPYRITVSHVQEAYIVLHQAAGALQAHFGMTLFLDIGFAIASTVYVSFQTLVEVVGQNWDENLLARWSTFVIPLWLLYNIAKLAMLATCCSAATEQASATRDILMTAMAVRGSHAPHGQLGSFRSPHSKLGGFHSPHSKLGDSQAPHSQLEQLLQQVVLTHPLRFSAAGFLTIDRRLLVSALAVTVTYLVMLTQFKPGNN